MRQAGAIASVYTRDVMSAEPSSPHLPISYLYAAGLLLIAIGIVLHALFPRYELKVIGEDGRAVIILDRWTSEFQRANYDAQGVPTLTPIVRPF